MGVPLGKKVETRRNTVIPVQKDGCSVIVILIVKSQVQDNCRYVDKPQEIRDDENLVKREYSCQPPYGLPDISIYVFAPARRTRSYIRRSIMQREECVCISS